MTKVKTVEPFAQVLMLGDQRFGILLGGPFDGRCYPLTNGTPRTLDVPGPDGAGEQVTVRYVLFQGFYRFVADQAAA